MIKVNDQEYEDSNLGKNAEVFILGVNQLSDERVERILQDKEVLKDSSIEEIRKIVEDEKIRISNRVLLSSVSFLPGFSNDYVVFLIDLQEKFIRPPSLTRVIYGLYSVGFYTQKSFEERIKWLQENKSKLKYPNLLNYLV